MDSLKSLQRDINVIVDSSADRNAKRRSLEKILKETVGGGKTMSPDLAALLYGDLVKPLAKCLEDSVEKCRELSIRIISGFTNAVEDILPFLPYILPAYSSRLSELEIVEPSEEIRLELVSTLIAMVDKAGPAFAPGVDETVKILGRTLLDPYPEVKKESCKLAICIAKHTPRAVSLHSTAITKALLPSLQHRHSAVRVMALRALQDVALTDAAGLEEATVMDTIRQLTLDKTPAVREVLYEVAYNWLSGLTDRYSLGYKILPILFSGITDEVTKLRARCEEYLEKLGMLYEREWESRVKDELDLTIGVGNVNLLQGRPRVGCRHLARDNTQKIVTKFIEGLQDWSPDTRFKSAVVLKAFIPYAEENITGYIGSILPALYKVLASDEPTIMSETERVAETVGRFVDPDLYLSLLLTHIKSNADALNFKLGCLKTLRSLLTGTPPHRLKAHLATLSEALGDPELAGSENVTLLRDVADLAAVIVVKLAEVLRNEKENAEAGLPTVEVKGGKEVDLEDVGYKLFVVLVTLSSVAGNENIKGWPEMMATVTSSLSVLGNAHQVTSDSGLFSIHFSKLLASLKETSGGWTRFSPELRVMGTLFLSSGGLVGSHLPEIIQLLGSLCEESRDVELRVSVLRTSHRLLALSPTPLNSTLSLLKSVPDLLEKVIWPSAIWRPGRKSMSVRRVAIENLHALLKFMVAIPAEPTMAMFARERIAPFLSEPSEFVPCIIGCLDEDDSKTRDLTLDSFGMLFGFCLSMGIAFQATPLKKIYPELLKRLDDSVDDIRVRACVVLGVFSEVLQSFYRQYPDLPDGSCGFINGEVYVETRLDDVHWVTLIKGICIHVDDSNADVSRAAADCLFRICKVSPAAVVREQLEAVRMRYRNVETLDRILQEI
ncbi:HEAT repeat-containing protein 2 [Dinochytrium kinnereticum]|nr:HEAT repeat-containing protein 2 [Dinochytrium kinnereticum]